MPVPSRRQDLQTLLDPLEARAWRPDHAGLWLDRYVAGQLERNESPGKAATPQQRLVREVHAIAPSASYARFFERWQRQLASMEVQLDGSEYRVQVRRATTTGRIAVGLGDASVIETAVRLHQTYGVPYLPGSALKGVASAYAHQYLADDGWRKGGRYHHILFGTTTAAGYVTFFDALYEPGTGYEGRPLWPDVITVHHKGYYEGQEHTPPADWDSPTPITFVSATGTYLLALGGPPGWVEKAFEILTLALAELGIGAKTSSGYGRLQVEGQTGPTTAQPGATAARQMLMIGTEITGQRARQTERIDFKGERVKGVRVTVNRIDAWQLPAKTTVEFFSMDEITGGGFRGVVADIDESVPGVLRVLLTRVKRPSVEG